MEKLSLIFLILLVTSTQTAPTGIETRGANCLNVNFFIIIFP